jgi:hypothetical protein
VPSLYVLLYVSLIKKYFVHSKPGTALQNILYKETFRGFQTIKIFFFTLSSGNRCKEIFVHMETSK